jgi:HD superfamily phosphohydrolase
MLHSSLDKHNGNTIQSSLENVMPQYMYMYMYMYKHAVVSIMSMLMNNDITLKYKVTPDHTTTCMAGNFYLEKRFAKFASSSHWQKILSYKHFVLCDCTEDMATFTALAKVDSLL